MENLICNKEKCTGCFACLNICPKNCITMVEDEFGCIYPKIDEEKCIKCNMCKKVCPSIKELDRKEIKNCYAMKAKENEIRNTSTSGGAATVISRYIINQGRSSIWGELYKK